MTDTAKDIRAILLMGAIDLLPNPVFIKNRDHVWIEANNAFCDYIGRTRENLLGKTDADLVSQDLERTHWERNESIFRSKKTSVEIQNFIDPNGKERWIESHKSYFEDHTGQPYIIGHLLDITEQRKREAALAEAVKQAKASLNFEKDRRLQSRTLSEFDEWLHSCKSLDELIKVIQKFMPRLLPNSSGQLFIYSNSRDVLENQCMWSSETDVEYIQADDCWALRRGRPYSYGNTHVDILCNHVIEDKNAEKIGEYLCIPILAYGDTVGLMHINYPEGSNVLQFKDAGKRRRSTTHQFATQCGEHISLALANVRLRDELQHQSRRDPLTGLYNRRYFLDCFRSALQAAERENQKLSLISLDADHFKQMNDVHGHDAGDHALRLISRMIEEACSSNEVPCRLGGEEFAILLPNRSLEYGVRFAETLRNEIAGSKLLYAGAELPALTVSVGIAEYPTHGSDPQTLLKEADRAMYRAKADGRNILRIAQSDSDVKAAVSKAILQAG